MRISHSHKILFVAVARTGSTSVRAALDTVSEIHSVSRPEVSADFPFYHHIPARELEPIFRERNWAWEEYRKFCVVRNPFDRVVSTYHHKLETGSRHAPGKPPGYNLLRKMKYHFYNKSFADWLKSEESMNLLSMSVEHYACDEQGELMLDRVLKFEELDAAFADYGEQLGLPQNLLTVPRKNQSKDRKDYRRYYTEELRDIVQQRYAYEFEHFGYTF